MFSIPPENLIEVIASDPFRQEFNLREPDGNLVCTLSRHEASTLCHHRYVCGRAHRHGLRHLELLVARAVAQKLLNRLISGRRFPLAEDNRTVERQIVAGGIVWSYRRNVRLVWSPEMRGNNV